MENPSSPAKVIWNEATVVSVLNNPEGQTGNHGNRFLIYRMLQALYKRQTESEQQTESTRLRNYVGFNAADARTLSNIAARSQQYRSLTEHQAVLVAGRLRKYLGQLLEVVAEHQQPELPAKLEYDSEHGRRFGIEPDRWFDLVNAMDAGEYTEFVAKLEKERNA